MASSASCRITSAAAAWIAPPAVAVWPEPPAIPAFGRSEEPILKVRASIPIPSPSAAIWASAVQDPWPMSIAPSSTVPVPSARISARAIPSKISAGKVAVPMPVPTRNPSLSRVWRGWSGRPAQPKASAPRR